MDTKTKMSKIELITTSMAFAKKYPMLQPADVAALMRAERSLHRLDELSCNVGLDERAEELVRKTERRAQAILDKRGADAIAYHQSDPRGGALVVVSRADLDGRDIDANYTIGIYV
ncbi:MAG: hypothetical protein V1929_08250 [bacterium]